MFNYCFVSGLVLTEPEYQLIDKNPQTIFELGIWLGPFRAGIIKVGCFEKLAAIAANAIHRKDRLAVVGAIGQYDYVRGEKKGPHELVLIATDFELVRRNSPAAGLGGLD